MCVGVAGWEGVTGGGHGPHYAAFHHWPGLIQSQWHCWACLVGSGVMVAFCLCVKQVPIVNLSHLGKGMVGEG